MVPNNLDITITWEGPFSTQEVIKLKKDYGVSPDWAGNDYGLYQIYGRHILCGKKALLYVGIATDETYSDRFKIHNKEWLSKEKDIAIFLGRVYDTTRHSKSDNWRFWTKDIELVERILIYKYSPHYNYIGISNPPDLSPNKIVRLIHEGKRGRLNIVDLAPKELN